MAKAKKKIKKQKSHSSILKFKKRMQKNYEVLESIKNNET